MIRREDWRYGESIMDRDYLADDQSFSDLVSEIATAVSKVASTGIDVTLEPRNGRYDDPVLKKLGCHRVSWRIQIDSALIDKFYNGRMGLRAQYYISPFEGRAANLKLIRTMRSDLVRVGEEHLDPDAGSIIHKSLDAKSAKVWIAEKDLQGIKVIRAGDLELETEAIQNDWLTIARAVKDGGHEAEYDLYSAAINGVRAPVADRLEVKGGWLTPDGEEILPKAKWYRDTEIFMFGFS